MFNESSALGEVSRQLTVTGGGIVYQAVTRSEPRRKPDQKTKANMIQDEWHLSEI